LNFNDLLQETKPAAIASLGKKNYPHFSKEIGFGLLNQYNEEAQHNSRGQYVEDKE
jgi:hypothetical protein